MIDGTLLRYVSEPVHLHDLRENEPLHIPSSDEYYEAVGRVLIAEDSNQYAEDTPFNLTDGPPPQVVASGTWSGLWVDNALSVDVTSVFVDAQIKNYQPYRYWRLRMMWYSGYLTAFQTNPSTPVPTLAYLMQSGSFQLVSGGYALGLASGNLITQVGSQFYVTGGPPGSPADLWFPIHFQIEVGYGNPTDDATTRTGTWRWPAWDGGVTTDYLHYRGWNPSWACYNGYANAPNVISLGGCPNTGSGGYVPPDDPGEL